MHLHLVSHQTICKYHIFLCVSHMRKYRPPSRRLNCCNVLWIAVTNLTISSTTLRNLFFCCNPQCHHIVPSPAPFPMAPLVVASSTCFILLPNSQTAVRGWNMASFRDSKRCQLAKLINLITKGWSGSSMSWLSWSWAVVLNVNPMQSCKAFLT